MIPCVICGRRFTLADIGTRLFISTGVCVYCYQEGLKMPKEQWCFGKQDSYDEDSKDCSVLCPDRRICRLVVTGGLKLGGGT